MYCVASGASGVSVALALGPTIATAPSPASSWNAARPVVASERSSLTTSSSFHPPTPPDLLISSTAVRRPASAGLPMNAYVWLRSMSTPTL